MMCGGSFCVWSILVAAAFLVSGLALSVFASQIHLSQRERPWHNGKVSGFARGSPFEERLPPLRGKMSPQVTKGGVCHRR